MTDLIKELREHCRATMVDGELPIVEHRELDALLDCAEALQAVTATLEWQAHGGCRATDGPIMSSADAVAMGRAAIAKLNGGNNAG